MFDIRKMQEQALFESITAYSGEQTARQIVHGGENESDPDWVKNSMQRLERQFDDAAVRHIRMNCQCGYGMEEKRKLVEALYQNASSWDEFANCEAARAAGLSHENGTLYLQFPSCPCPMLAEVDRLPTSSWCQCTTGYSKVLFEAVFGCDVDVELLRSVKMGDDVCLMSIAPSKELFSQR